MPRRILRFALPSLVAACLASLAAGLSEAATSTASLAEALAATGFGAVFGVPAGLALSVAGRALWRAWRPAELAAALGEGQGSAPRLAAWVLYLFCAALVLATLTFQGIRGLFAVSNDDVVVALGTPMIAVAVAVLMAALSRPCVDALAVLVRRLERRVGRVLATPRAVIAAALAAMAAALALSWQVSIAPRIGHLELDFAVHLALYAAVLAAVPLAWPRLGRRQSAALALSLAGVVAALGAAGWARYLQPYAMLSVWGEARLAGLAIDSLYDVQGLRGELELKGVRPEPLAGVNERPDIVLVTVDTLRADRTPLYGGPAKMPELAALGKRGVVFEHAYSSGNVTRRSLPTIATGASPPRIQGRVAGWALRMDPRHVTVAERLRAGGYDTAGFFCCSSFFGAEHRLGLIRGLDHVAIEYGGGALSEQAVAWLGARAQRGDDDPLFLWLHYIEPHNWKVDHKDRGKGRRDRYDASLEATDAYLGTLIDGVRASLGDDALIVLTADHGEGLGDHGVPYHSGTLHDSETRVPLVFAGGGLEPRRLETVVGLVDLAPTLLELAGFRPPGMPAMDGLSVAGLLRGEVADRFGAGEAYSVMMEDRSVGKSVHAVVSGRYRLIEKRNGDVLELYDLEGDPYERFNVAEKLPRITDSMRARLERRRLLDLIPAY